MNEDEAQWKHRQRFPMSVLSLTDCDISEFVQNTLSPHLYNGVTFAYLYVCRLYAFS